MITIIAGSREGVCYQELLDAIMHIKPLWTPTTVISGGASGADTFGEWWAKENDVPLIRKPADWDRYGKSAGYKRNEEMAEEAEALLALWDGESRGTGHMIDIAKRKGLLYYVYLCPEIPF